MRGSARGSRSTPSAGLTCRASGWPAPTSSGASSQPSPRTRPTETRSALWLINEWHAEYCDDTYAEIDVLEWYSSTDDARSTTHATCTWNPDRTTTKATVGAGSPADDPHASPVDWTRPHTWAVRKTD